MSEVQETEKGPMEDLLERIQHLLTERDCAVLAELIHAYYVLEIGVRMPPLLELLTMGVADGKDIQKVLVNADKVYTAQFGSNADAVASINVMKRGLRYFAAMIEQAQKELEHEEEK